MSFVQCSKIKFSANRLVETNHDEVEDKIGPDFTFATSQEPSHNGVEAENEDDLNSSPASTIVDPNGTTEDGSQDSTFSLEQDSRPTNSGAPSDGNSTFSLEEGSKPTHSGAPSDGNSTFSLEEDSKPTHSGAPSDGNSTFSLDDSSKPTTSVGQNSGDSTFILKDGTAGTESTFVVEDDVKFDEISANVQNVLSSIEMSANSAPKSPGKRIFDRVAEDPYQPPTPPKKARQDSSSSVGQKENPLSGQSDKQVSAAVASSNSTEHRKDPLKINNA